MSIAFSDSTNKTGIVELIDDLLDTNETSYPIKKKTRDINLAYDEVMYLIFQTGGTWQWDDSNHTSYPILTTDIVSGQRDYSFVADSAGNLILEIYKVMVADSTGLFREITPVDVPAGAPVNYYDGLNTDGIPNTYDKLGSGIFLDPIPNYNYTGGLKIYVNREGMYFTSTDTTKKAGFAGILHEYLAIRPAYYFAIRHSMPIAQGLFRQMEDFKMKILDFYKIREKDVVKRLTAKEIKSY